MKKILAVIMAVIMAASCMSVLAFAADNYTSAYFVTAPTSCAKQYKITPWKADSNYVKAGETFRFTITPVGSYEVNDTCVIKAAGTDYAVENITDPDAVEGEVLYPEMITVTEKDKDGNDVEVTYAVYTIAAVNNDTYIVVCNIAPKSISGVLDFLNGLFNFFVTFINWFFGLAKVR